MMELFDKIVNIENSYEYPWCWNVGQEKFVAYKKLDLEQSFVEWFKERQVSKSYSGWEVTCV